MRLFHVSEESDIQVFQPRLPSRKDLDPAVGLVWALDEARLPNFLTPRNCPRVAYHAGPETTQEDRNQFFTSTTACHVVVIEHGWLEAMKNTILYLYEFDPGDFSLQDQVAGYYVATSPQRPVAKHKVEDLLGELTARNVEVRLTDQLWDIADRVKSSTLNWSLCRMAFARKKAGQGARVSEISG